MQSDSILENTHNLRVVRIFAVRSLTTKVPVVGNNFSLACGLLWSAIAENTSFIQVEISMVDGGVPSTQYLVDVTAFEREILSAHLS